MIPRPGRASEGYDLVIASQPYRARMPADFKVKKVLTPLARSLGPGGRLLCIQSHGGDPGLEIVRQIWPDERPFQTDRHVLLKALKAEIGKSRRDLNYNAYTDRRAIFRYDMHTLPTEIEGSSIGTSTLFAAWNAAIYVAQIEDARLEGVGLRRLLSRRDARGPHCARRALVLRRILRGLAPPRLAQYATLPDHGSPNETHLPLSPSPEGGGGTQAAAPVTPSPPPSAVRRESQASGASARRLRDNLRAAERAGVRWGVLGPRCMKR